MLSCLAHHGDAAILQDIGVPDIRHDRRRRADLEQVIVGLRRQRQVAAQASEQIFAASAAVLAFRPGGVPGKRETGSRSRPIASCRDRHGRLRPVTGAGQAVGRRRASLPRKGSRMCGCAGRHGRAKVITCGEIGDGPRNVSRLRAEREFPSHRQARRRARRRRRWRRSASRRPRPRDRPAQTLRPGRRIPAGSVRQKISAAP